MKFIKLILLLFLFLFLFVSSICYGQTTNLPSIIPPSPQVANFLKFGDYPVAYNTGIPDISIPLYTIKSGQIEVPIILRYHSGGVKPNEEDASNIGVGWTLDVGGIIARDIRDMADEGFQKPLPFLKASEIDENNQDHYSYLYQAVVTRNYDTEYDQFSYSFLDNSGKFVIDDNRDGTFKAYSYPFKPFKIDVQTGPPTGYMTYRSITGIDITDDNGTQFKFGHSNVEYVGSGIGSTTGPSGWFLEEIETATKSDKVSFSYESVPDFYTSQQNSKHVFVEGDDGRFVGIEGGFVSENCDPNRGIYPECQFNNSSADIYYNTKALSLIIFKEGKVTFNLDDTKRKINSIQVFDNNNQVVRSIVFNRVLANSGLQYKLTSISVTGASGSPEEKYQFSYFDDLDLTGYSNPPVDYWGYCKGDATYPAGHGGDCAKRDITFVYGDDTGPNQGTIVTQTVGTVSYEPDETPDAHYLKHNILTQIKYPTGGTTDFEFEPNTYIDALDGTHSERRGGGLRIKQIKSNDGKGNALTKTYEYEPGFIEHSMLDLSNYVSSVRNVTPLCTDPVWGTKTYYNLRNTTYFNSWNGNLGSNNVYYKKVTEYFGNAVSNTGKVEYNYTYENPNEMHTGIINETIFSTYIKKYRNWGNGLLHIKNVYKNDDVNGYQIVQNVVNNYEFVDLKTLDNLLTGIACTYPTWDTRNDLMQQGSISGPLTYPFKYADYTIVTGAFYLKSTQNTEYSTSGSLVTTTEYEYANPNHYYPTRILQSTSLGEKRVAALSYVDEFSTIVPYSSMKLLNILKPIIETKQYLRNTSGIDQFLKSTKTNYDFWNGTAWSTSPTNIIVPRTVESKTLSNNSEVRVRYDSYDDRGNITTVSKENDVKKTYLWGYNKTYPVAEIVNADCATASQYIDQSVLDAATGNGDDVSLRSELNKLRTNLPNALVTSYTYKPLVGMTSATDPNGRTTYYEYDGFGRLSLVRDKDNNILKKICYNYQGQQEACPLGTVSSQTFYSHEVNSNFYSQNCGSQSPVAYPVYLPQGYFTSTISQPAADQLADQYAQSQANQYGSCTAPTPQTIYARIEVENFSEDNHDNFASDGSEEVADVKTGDVWVKFYSDAACTQPLILTAPITVNWSDEGFFETSTSYDDTPYYYSTDVSAGVNGFELSGVSSLGGQYYWYDADGNLVDYEYWRDYYHITANGTVYNIVAPNQVPDNW